MPTAQTLLALLTSPMLDAQLLAPTVGLPCKVLNQDVIREELGLLGAGGSCS